MLTLLHERPVGVLGEGKRGKAELEGPLAALFHRTARGVPRPLRVHVEIGREGHATRLMGNRPSPSGAARHLAGKPVKDARAARRLIAPASGEGNIESRPWGTWSKASPMFSAPC